jgi:thiamine biosynthesis lipoprotein
MTLVVRYLFIFSLLLTGCVSNEKQYQGFIFGTYYNIKILDPLNLNNLQKSIDSKLEEIDMLFSNYNNDSYLMKFNKNKNQPINTEFEYLLNHSIEICDFVNQNFNVFSGNLVNLWGFGPTKRIDIPKATEIEKVIPSGCSYDSNNHLEIDFSAIAKGYAVDEISQLLDDQNLKNYFIDIGGEILIKGKKKENSWVICIENPDINNSKPIKCISKKENEKFMAIATSGDYRNYFIFDNKRYSHTINPRSGYPISNNLTSVSVALPGQFRHTGDADALATALNVMGLKNGFNFAVNNSIAALFVFKSENEFFIKMTPSFEDIIH